MKKFLSALLIFCLLPQLALAEELKTLVERYQNVVLQSQTSAGANLGAYLLLQDLELKLSEMGVTEQELDEIRVFAGQERDRKLIDEKSSNAEIQANTALLNKLLEASDFFKVNNSDRKAYLEVLKTFEQDPSASKLKYYLKEAVASNSSRQFYYNLLILGLGILEVMEPTKSPHHSTDLDKAMGFTLTQLEGYLFNLAEDKGTQIPKGLKLTPETLKKLDKGWSEKFPQAQNEGTKSFFYQAGRFKALLERHGKFSFMLGIFIYLGGKGIASQFTANEGIQLLSVVGIYLGLLLGYPAIRSVFSRQDYRKSMKYALKTPGHNYIKCLINLESLTSGSD